MQHTKRLSHLPECYNDIDKMIDIIIHGEFASSPSFSLLLNSINPFPTVDHLHVIDGFTSFVERYAYIHTLQELKYPFKDEDQPEAWIQRLLVCKEATPGSIVELIERMFGIDLICREASELHQYPIKIVDAIGMFLNDIQDHREIENYKEIEMNTLLTIINLQGQKKRNGTQRVVTTFCCIQRNVKQTIEAVIVNMIEVMQRKRLNSIVIVKDFLVETF